MPARDFMSDSHAVQNAMLRDEDGSFLGGNGGAVVARADVFSPNSFFGIPYNDPINRPANLAFWYPNLPVAMRSDRCLKFSCGCTPPIPFLSP